MDLEQWSKHQASLLGYMLDNGESIPANMTRKKEWKQHHWASQIIGDLPIDWMNRMRDEVADLGTW